MGEIRFVGTGETRRYPYPVFKKKIFSIFRLFFSCGVRLFIVILVIYKYKNR